MVRDDFIMFQAFQDVFRRDDFADLAILFVWIYLFGGVTVDR